MQILSHIGRIHYTVVVARNPSCDHRGQFSTDYELPFSKLSNRSVDADAIGTFDPRDGTREPPFSQLHLWSNSNAHMVEAYYEFPRAGRQAGLPV
jgi:hypothetical protein